MYSKYQRFTLYHEKVRNICQHQNLLTNFANKQRADVLEALKILIKHKICSLDLNSSEINNL